MLSHDYGTLQTGVNMSQLLRAQSAVDEIVEGLTIGPLNRGHKYPLCASIQKFEWSLSNEVASRGQSI